MATERGNPDSGLGRLVGTALVVLGVGSAVGNRPEAGDRADPAATAPPPDAGEAGTGGGLTARIDRFQKRFAPVGFVYAVVKKYGEDAGGRLAAGVAYYGFFSIFPSILALVAVTGFVLDDRPEWREDLVESAVGQFPVIGDSVADASLGGSGLALAVGLAGALWAGMGAFMAAQHALNEIWAVPHHDRPNLLVARARALLMLVLFAFGLAGGVVLARLVAVLSIPGIARVGIVAGNIAIDIGVAWLAFQILTAKRLRWSTLLPGAVIAGLGYFGMQALGGYLADRFVSNASDTYGTFAFVIGLLTWLHILSQLTLLAGVVNVVVARKLFPRTLFGDDLTDADRRALLLYQQGAARHEDHEPHTLPPRE